MGNNKCEWASGFVPFPYLMTTHNSISKKKNVSNADRQFHLNKYKMSNKYYGQTDLVKFVIYTGVVCVSVLLMRGVCQKKETSKLLAL